VNEFQDESNESLEPQADPMPGAGENISQDSQESQDSQQDSQESAPEVSGSDTVESAEPAQPEDESSEQVEAAPSEQPEEIDGEVVDEVEEEAETEPEAESDNSTEDADEATEAEAVEEDLSTEEAEAEDDGSDEAPEEVAEEVVEPEAEAEPEPEPESETESDDSAEDAPFDPHNIPKKYDSQTFEWYILKVQVNRETSIRDGLLRRIKMEGLEEYFEEVMVPTEDIVEFTRSGKRKVVKRKLYPGYIMVNMMLQDDSWFLVRETPGIGDFTGTLGKPSPMPADEVERILSVAQPEEEADGEEPQLKTAIPFKAGDRVRVKDGNFQNFEGEVDGIDEANGRVTLIINIFGRSTPVELEHWQIEEI
tara:strand:+ start:1024 stop:2121 length:1098 start_codon:yes stop_codon:yes gene_type:complete